MNIREYSSSFLEKQGYKEVKDDLWLKSLDNIDAKIYVDYREGKSELYGYQDDDSMTSEKQKNLLKRIRRELRAKNSEKQTEITDIGPNLSKTQVEEDQEARLFNNE